MGIVITIATFAILGFIGWLIYRAVKGKSLKAHVVSYSVACVAGVYTYAFFLSMDIIPQLIKIVISILLGMALIVVAAFLQRRQPSKP